MRAAPASLLCLLLAAALITPGCRRGSGGSPASTPDAPRVVTAQSGPVRLRLIVDPPRVRLDRDLLLTVEVTAPTNVTVALPALEGRAQGFSVARGFDPEPEFREGQLVRQRCARLTPELARRYRIAPMAVGWSAPGTGVPAWFATPAVALDVQPLARDAGKEPAGVEGPVWIRPSLRTLGLGLAGLALAAAALWGLWRALAAWRRRLALRRLSPRERALQELADLLRRDLVARGQVKEFYFELTRIVRCYIERAHAVRAPEQTTEEFLAAVSRDSRFGPAVVERLRAFLRAADLVKYAAQRPEPAAVDQAVATARSYVETDAQERTREAPPC